MALNPVPWAIDGGKVSAADARRVAYAASSGATGITSSNDFRVVASTPSGPSVLVYAGSGVIAQVYASSSKSQSYVVSADTGTTVPVAATAGSARTDYLILKVTDPQYGGQAPADLVNGPYVSFALVPSITGLTYPFLALAQITQPANNGAITQAMITPLRAMANPRRQRDVSTYSVATAAAQTQTQMAASGEIWPAGAVNDWGGMAVPAWATQVRVVCTWAQVYVPAGNATGNLWVQLGVYGALGTQAISPVTYDTTGGTSQSRATYVNGGRMNVPANLRGTVQPVRPMAQLLTKSSDAARIRLDGGSAVIMDTEWLEAPTEDD